MASIIANGLQIDVHRGDSPNPYEDILKIAIERGCDVSLVSSLDSMWRRSLGTVTGNQMILRYKALLNQIHYFRETSPNKASYFYVLILLELLDFDEGIKFNIFTDKQHKIIDILKKDIDISLKQTHKLSYVFDDKRSASEYERWAHDRERFSFQPGYKAPPKTVRFFTCCVNVIDAGKKDG